MPLEYFVKFDKNTVMSMKKTARIVKIAAFLLIALQVFAIITSAQDNILSLYRNNAQESIPFNVTNMFPGDCETNVYNIRVSYNGPIKVYFTADVRSGYEKLAEVLKCKVVMSGNSIPLYDGLMKDIPDLEHSLSAVNTTEDLEYEISVYLDTSVGNDYKNKELVADFKWWAYTQDEGHPGGGGSSIRPQRPVIPPGVIVNPTVPPDGGEPTTPPDNGEDKPMTPPDGDEPLRPQPNAPKPPEAEGEVPAFADTNRPTGELIAPPKTGDIANPALWITLICISLFVILLLVFFKKKKGETKEEKNPVIKKLTVCIVIIVILAMCLCVTTFALVYSIVSVDENIFKTGTVEINLNDGNPIITEKEFLFEPGMRVKKDFFIENESSDDVYYKIYFDNITGGLARVLDVKILDKETGISLYSGKAKDLIRENCDSAELLLNEKRTLTAEFHYPEESGNETPNMSLTFDMCAVATQKKNNEGREFN